MSVAWMICVLFYQSCLQKSFPADCGPTPPLRVPLQGGDHNSLSRNLLGSPPVEGWPKAGVGSEKTFATDSPGNAPLSAQGGQYSGAVGFADLAAVFILRLSREAPIVCAFPLFHALYRQSAPVAEGEKSAAEQRCGFLLNRRLIALDDTLALTSRSTLHCFQLFVFMPEINSKRLPICSLLFPIPLLYTIFHHGITRSCTPPLWEWQLPS